MGFTVTNAYGCKYLNIKTQQVYAEYHLLFVHPELYGVELTADVLAQHGLAVLQFAPLPAVAPYQRIVEGEIVDNVQQWVVEDLPLESLQSEKMGAVNAWRDSENLKPVQYQGELFDADQESQFRVLAVVMMGTGSPTGYWTSADNKDIPANAAFMQGLYAAMITRVATVHHRQRRMKTEIQALTTPDEVYAYQVGVT